MGCALQAEALCKRLGGTVALDAATLELRSREVVGLIGVNGAGKSTLLKVLGGLLPADSGQLLLRGRTVRWRNVAEANNAGVATMHQELQLVPGLSVAENILLGNEGAAVRWGVIRWRRLFALAGQQLEKLGASISPQALVESLPFANQQMVALARVLAVEERTDEEPIVLLDEPTSTLEPGEIERVLQHVTKLRSRASVVFVSHRLHEVLRVCDRVYVMRGGRCVAMREARNCTIEDLQRLMLEDPREGTRTCRETPRAYAGRPVRLAVQGLARKGEYADIDFDLHEGEVLGLAGVARSGCDALCRTLFGIEPPDAGAILLDGRAVALASPADAAARGIGYVPAERSSEGIIGDMSVAENMTLARLDRFRKRFFIDRAGERRAVAHWIERLRIATPSASRPAAELSGGNQQKLALAKWLIDVRPRVLILDHPLRGLDVAARGEVCKAIRELAAEGTSFLLIADTLDELLTLSDSVLALRDGRICARFSVAQDAPAATEILASMV